MTNKNVEYILEDLEKAIIAAVYRPAKVTEAGLLKFTIAFSNFSPQNYSHIFPIGSSHMHYMREILTLPRCATAVSIL